ncbi:MAG TPA: MBL fold metallo-hydrolase [Frankiaceae bacterium]|nr:MBL fold metallo-hydrolase [Frankiaceae bacterium]
MTEPAQWTVLCDGYVGDRVASTVTYVRDGDTRIVIDPGMVASRDLILAPLARLGVAPQEVTDVVFSHHHPDHTLNAALFPRARYHDFWAVYQDDVWTSRPADGYRLSPAVRLLATPGHTEEDITTLIDAEEGTVAFTHCWWHAAGPAEDPYAWDAEVLRASRQKVLALAQVVVPGHGAPFTPDAATPR